MKFIYFIYLIDLLANCLYLISRNVLDVFSLGFMVKCHEINCFAFSVLVFLTFFDYLKCSYVF